MQRRTFLTRCAGVAMVASGGLIVGPGTWTRSLSALAAPTGVTMRTRVIPKSGEVVPEVGLGTWQTFDVGTSAAERAPLAEILRLFFEAGGRLIDSSPMYGRAESVVGELVEAQKATPFFATKVWTSGKDAGRTQMAESMRRFRLGKRPLDLMQVHNLLDLEAHLPTLRELKAAGQIRYLGITHYALSRFPEMERLLKTEIFDFIQLPYSVRVRDAEKRLLPTARDTRTAVIVMRPFEEGDLFSAVKGREVPEWAKAAGYTSWAELFLAFILGHEAVTCVIPATSKPHHLSQNVRAGSAPIMTTELRERLVRELA